jgi:hypothetical protein
MSDWVAQYPVLRACRVVTLIADEALRFGRGHFRSRLFLPISAGGNVSAQPGQKSEAKRGSWAAEGRADPHFCPPTLRTRGACEAGRRFGASEAEPARAQGRGS